MLLVETQGVGVHTKSCAPSVQCAGDVQSSSQDSKGGERGEEGQNTETFSTNSDLESPAKSAHRQHRPRSFHRPFETMCGEEQTFTKEKAD